MFFILSFWVYHASAQVNPPILPVPQSPASVVAQGNARNNFETVYVELTTDRDADSLNLTITPPKKAAKIEAKLQQQRSQKRTYSTFLVSKIPRNENYISKFQYNIEGNPVDLISHARIVMWKGKETLAITLFTKQGDYENFLVELNERLAKLKQGTPPTAQQTQKAVAKNTQKSEKERLEFEMREAVNREKNKAVFDRLSPAEKAAKKVSAKTFYEKSLSLAKMNDLIESEKALVQAIIRDPSEDLYYYAYGINLFKQNKNNQSLAMFSLAQGGEFNQAEYDYYIALNHMKLEEFDKALEEFESIRDDKDPYYSAVAGYLAGSIQFQFQKYDEARKNFETVLDISNDPKLDADAEKMIEAMNQIEAFKEIQKQYLRYSFFTGLTYDQNVLNVATQNLATNVEAYRLGYGSTVWYKISKKEKSEVGLQALYSDIYSVDKSGKATPTLQSADPQVMSLSVPMKFQGEAKENTPFYSVTPSYQLLFMNPDGTKRRQVLGTLQLTSDMTKPVTPTWIGVYKLEYGKDQSFLTASSVDDELNAERWTLGTTQVKLLNAQGTQTLAGDWNYTHNRAQGLNNEYKRQTLGLTYGFPSFSGYAGSFRIETVSADYFRSSAFRLDSGRTFTLGHSKEIAKALSFSGNIIYTQNTSNVDLYKYNKWMFSVLFTYAGSLTEK